MALIPILIKFLNDKSKDFKIKGNVITIGKQEIILTFKQFEEIFEKRINKKITDIDILKNMGATNVHSLGYLNSKYSNIKCNLNVPFVNKQFYNKYDCILDGGTMEHVFNTLECLRTFKNLLKIGGTIIHMNPCLGYFNHGFYSFQPTFYFDFYESNGFSKIECYIFEFLSHNYYNFDCEVNIKKIENGNKFRSSNNTLIIFKAEKKYKTKLKIPIQKIYR